MEQPEVFVQGYIERLVCKLKKSLYGLKQSPRQWYKKFDSFMVSQKFIRSEYGHHVYFKSFKGIFIILALYVDDMLIPSKSMEDINMLKDHLSRTFDMKDLGDGSSNIQPRKRRTRTKKVSPASSRIVHSECGSH